ncbi:MAG: hypothetical protein ACYC1I_11690 [Acidimicrobiales bacterium]
MNKRPGSFNDRLRAAAAPQEVPVLELFTDEFIKEATGKASLREFLDAGPVSSQFKTIRELSAYLTPTPPPEWDEFIRESTGFATWQDMANAAYVAWMRRKLAP